MSAVATPHTTRRYRVLKVLLVLVAVPAILILAVFALVFYGRNLPQPTIPFINIDLPGANNGFYAGNAIIVFSDAQDPDGVVSSELWINGEMAISDSNSEGGTPFRTSQAWRPKDAGAYSVFVRAVDNLGFIGQSEILMINVKAKPESFSDEAFSEEISNAGISTIPVTADIASNSEESSISEAGIPASPALPSGEDIIFEEASAPMFFSGLGRICFWLPSLCSSDGSEGSPSAEDPASLEIPDWAADLCRGLPSFAGCPAALLPGWEGPAAPRVSAIFSRDCQVQVIWTDESDDEVGFKLYRGTAASSLELIAFTENAGVFVDSPGAAGSYNYVVAAYNSGGETPSAPSPEVIVPESDCRDAGSGSGNWLDLEALTLNLTQSVDRMYCYYSVDELPFARIPSDPVKFMELREGSWNISDYAGGSNRIRIAVSEDLPLTVAAECFGWQGIDLIPLGSFNQSHPREEWDGRILTAATENFTLTYRLNPPAELSVEGAPMAIVDGTVPAPYDLHLSRRTCIGGGSEPFACTIEDQLGLGWRWEMLGADARRLVRFNVFYRFAEDLAPEAGSFGAMSSAISPRIQYTETRRHWAPFGLVMPCVANINPGYFLPDENNVFTLQADDLVIAKDLFYSVQAVVSDPATGQTVESPMSEELQITSTGCPRILAVELDVLNWIPDTAAEWRSLGLNLVGVDHCDPADVYGIIDIGGTRIWWNAPYSEHPSRLRAPNPSGATPPAYTRLGCTDATQVFFHTVGLDQETADYASGFAYGNNVVLVPVDSESASLDVYFWMFDYDSGFNFGDDVWCEGGDTFQEYTLNSDAQVPVFSSFTEYEDHRCHILLNIHPLEIR